LALDVVKVYRGEVVEATHSGHLAVVNSEGKILYKIGDPQLVTYLRSSAKPFQTIPLIESGAAHRFKFMPEEIAIISGSHSGETKHVETVSGILDKIGLTPKHLQCGIHQPHFYLAKNITPEPGEKFSVLQHNCSGKHAGMLALCVFKGLPVENYLEPTHPVQELITEAIAYVCNYPKENIKIGIDGCSAPVHALPLYNMAYGFARFVSPHSVPPAKAKVYTAIYRAMLDHPDMVAGEMRYDTELMKNCSEKLIAKGGAEGLHCLGLLERGWGIAAKIADGATRAIYPYSVEVLKQLGIITTGELTRLANFHKKKIFNWTDKEIGSIVADFELTKDDES
jgi:L-asparaginase II